MGLHGDLLKHYLHWSNFNGGLTISGGGSTPFAEWMVISDCDIKSLNVSNFAGILYLYRCNFSNASTFSLNPSFSYQQIIMIDCAGIPDDVSVFNATTGSYLPIGLTSFYKNGTQIIANLSERYYTRNETPVQSNELTSKSYVDTQVNTKQDVIVDGGLSISKTAELQTSLNAKQDIIVDGGLTIDKIADLQTSLNAKQDIIVDGGLTIDKIADLQISLNAKQNVIPVGGLTIAKTANLQNSLDSKQATLTAGDNISIVDNVISSTGGGGGGDITQADLETKQDVLTAGTNITIVDNVISSTGGGGGGDITQTDLDTKQDVLTAGTGITLFANVISAGSSFIGFKLCSSIYHLVLSAGPGSGAPTADQIYTDGGTPFNWDRTLFNVGGGIVGSSTYTASQQQNALKTYPYYEVGTAGYYKLSYSIGQNSSNSTFLKVYVIRETAPLTGTVVLAVGNDQPAYKEYNETIVYLDVGDRVWMKRGGFNQSTGINYIEGADPIGYFAGVYLGN